MEFRRDPNGTGEAVPRRHIGSRKKSLGSEVDNVPWGSKFRKDPVAVKTSSKVGDKQDSVTWQQESKDGAWQVEDGPLAVKTSSEVSGDNHYSAMWQQKIV